MKVFSISKKNNFYQLAIKTNMSLFYYQGNNMAKKRIEQTIKNDILIVRNDFYEKYMSTNNTIFSDKNFNIVILNNATYSTYQSIIKPLFVR